MHNFLGTFRGVRAFPSHLILISFLLLIAITSTACQPQLPTPTQAPIRATQTPKPTFTSVPAFTPTDTPRPTDTPVPTATPSPTATPVPTDVSPLTGTKVEDLDHLRRRVLAVRVGNDPEIRPQEGLGRADVVYEELMEGWALTRFTAIYLNNNAERIRPIRSSRLVTLDIVPQYDGALVHSGANDTIRYMISQASFVDLDEYFHPQPYGLLSGYDWRGRLYTSVEAVHEYLEKKGWERKEPIEGYQFSSQVPIGDSASAIHIPYPRLCAVDWTYAVEKGYYLRQVQGEPHVDALTGEQLHAANVILFYTKHKATDLVDSNGARLIDIEMSGSGPAEICRDGVVVEGEWIEKAPRELIEYYDDEGNIIPLKPGKTWIELVPLDYDVDME
ncbi:MAG: DUF3048 domain-containing protein [Chloroflexota bacterium]|nr:DUF3048 domain-containing protein [Chloroflexota bacterium]